MCIVKYMMGNRVDASQKHDTKREAIMAAAESVASLCKRGSLSSAECAELILRLSDIGYGEVVDARGWRIVIEKCDE